MARLIDAEIAIKELRTFCFDCAIHPYHGRCAKCGIGNALDIVNGISTVDAAVEPIAKQDEMAYDTMRACAELKALRAQPENKPLTLDELREMDGQPVWFRWQDSAICGYAIVNAAKQVVTDKHGWFLDFADYEKSWLAYRHKPKEGLLC